VLQQSLSEIPLGAGTLGEGEAEEVEENALIV
jgi:hypothetical protein